MHNMWEFDEQAVLSVLDQLNQGLISREDALMSPAWKNIQFDLSKTLGKPIAEMPYDKIHVGAENYTPFAAAIGLINTESDYCVSGRKLIYNNPFINDTIYLEYDSLYGFYARLDKMSQATRAICEEIRSITKKVLVTSYDIDKWLYEQYTGVQVL